jgi:hypothetical protein
MPRERDTKFAASEECAHLLQHAEGTIKVINQHMIWVLLFGVIVALASIALNLSVVEIQNFEFKEVKFIFKNLLFIKLCLVGASITTVAALVFLCAMHIKAVQMIDFLAAKKHYKKAAIYFDFSKWLKEEKREQNLFIDISYSVVFAFVLLLLLVLPISTFVFSLVRS